MQHSKEQVASGSSKVTEDLQELAAAKRSRSRRIRVAASGNRRQTKIQKAATIVDISQRVSFVCEHMCSKVEDPHELVVHSGRLQKSSDCLAVQLRKQPTYPMQSALVS